MQLALLLIELSEIKIRMTGYYIFIFQERLQTGHHAAMDFSAGCGGRIISDPAEAAIIAKTSCRLRSLPMSASPGLGSSKSSLETVFDPNQDVSLTGCSEAWFQPNMGREQANSLLFPHRY